MTTNEIETVEHLTTVLMIDFMNLQLYGNGDADKEREVYSESVKHINSWKNQIVQQTHKDLREKMGLTEWWDKLYRQDSFGNFVTCGQEVLDDILSIIPEE